MLNRIAFCAIVLVGIEGFFTSACTAPDGMEESGQTYDCHSPELVGWPSYNEANCLVACKSVPAISREKCPLLCTFSSCMYNLARACNISTSSPPTAGTAPRDPRNTAYYGNHCGKDPYNIQKTFPIVDAFDGCCYIHDRCYETRIWNKLCDASVVGCLLETALATLTSIPCAIIRGVQRDNGIRIVDVKCESTRKYQVDRCTVTEHSDKQASGNWMDASGHILRIPKVCPDFDACKRQCAEKCLRNDDGCGGFNAIEKDYGNNETAVKCQYIYSKISEEKSAPPGKEPNWDEATSYNTYFACAIECPTTTTAAATTTPIPTPRPVQVSSTQLGSCTITTYPDKQPLGEAPLEINTFPGFYSSSSVAQIRRNAPKAA